MQHKKNDCLKNNQQQIKSISLLKNDNFFFPILYIYFPPFIYIFLNIVLVLN
jgi:hypothetical protein